jgi:CBS domain-containing protein
MVNNAMAARAPQSSRLSGIRFAKTASKAPCPFWKWRSAVVGTTKPLLNLTAADLMSRSVVLVPEQMSLVGAARLLAGSHISGAPVVDGAGRCVGVLSATDFVNVFKDGGRRQPAHAGTGPSCFCFPWQLVEAEDLPEESVQDHMTSDPVMVPPSAAITELAQIMLDAHIHRVIVVDEEARPVGVVSTTDILAAVAQAARQRVALGATGPGGVAPRAPQAADI